MSRFTKRRARRRLGSAGELPETVAGCLIGPDEAGNRRRDFEGVRMVEAPEPIKLSLETARRGALGYDERFLTVCQGSSINFRSLVAKGMRGMIRRGLSSQGVTEGLGICPTVQLTLRKLFDADFAGVSHGWEKFYWTPWRDYLEQHES